MQNAIELRRADENDSSVIVEINAVISADDISAHLWAEKQVQQALKQHLVWLLLYDNIPLAYAVFSCVLDEAELLMLAVHSQYRRQGLAGSLLSAIFEQLREEFQAKFCFLEVRASNQGAIALYQKLAFEQVGLRKNYYSAGAEREDALLMKCEL